MKNYFLHLKTLFFGTLAGTDSSGNAYYYQKGNPKKRWVVYKGKNEATKIPPHWHCWIHGFSNIPLNLKYNYSWQKPHLPNLTGTPLAYKPYNTVKKENHKYGYTSWRPSK